MPLVVNFIGVGVSKAGSATFFPCLIQHPDISGPAGDKNRNTKEAPFFNILEGTKPQVFDSEGMYCKDINQYLGRFDFSKPVRGEWTPSYIMSDEALHKIYEHNPDVKILYMVRHPLRRLWSEYNSYLEKGFYRVYDKTAFKDIIDVSRLTASPVNFEPRIPGCLVYNSMYADHLDRLYSIFPEENVHVIRHEEFRMDQETIVRDTMTFLGVNEKRLKKFRPQHNNKTKKYFPKEVYLEQHDRLCELLYEDNKRAKEVYGIDYDLCYSPA